MSSMNSTTMDTQTLTTFVHLYEWLRSTPFENENEFTTWMLSRWHGKDKQESLMRLFAGLYLLPGLKPDEFKVSSGNFNKGCVIPHTSLRDVFYDADHNQRCLKDKGDASDLTLVSTINPKSILATTSKSLTKELVGKLDIEKLYFMFNQPNGLAANGFTMSMAVCIRNAAGFEEMKSRVESTNAALLDALSRDDTIIIDWGDLFRAYQAFTDVYSNQPIQDIMDTTISPCVLQIHQHLGVEQTWELKRSGVSKIIWGHAPRSGKTYIMAGCIIRAIEANPHANILVVTTCPKETVQQYRTTFRCSQLRNLNIVHLTSKTESVDNINPNGGNIIICSKQYLQFNIDCPVKKRSKINHSHTNTTSEPVITKNIKWLRKMKFELRFVDESHRGGSTTLAQQTLKYYGNTAFTVYVSATYSKPMTEYGIPPEHCVSWNMEDVMLCKYMHESPSNLDLLLDKHGPILKGIIERYGFTPKTISDAYAEYPELKIFTRHLTAIAQTEIIAESGDTNYGWSGKACFLLEQSAVDGNVITTPKFQDEASALNLWRDIFGERTTRGVEKRPDAFMPRINKFCTNSATSTRFMGNMNGDPMVIMAFLPQNGIANISQATKELFNKHHIADELEVISINSTESSDPKGAIEAACNKVRTNDSKKGVLVLSGTQCSLGVTIDCCDVVILLNQTISYDMIFQMMNRSMTPGEGKRYGFVIDPDINRLVSTLVTCASHIKPTDHPRDGIKYMMRNQLMSLNPDDWMPCFGKSSAQLDELCDHLYNEYITDTNRALLHLDARLARKSFIPIGDDALLANNMFSRSLFISYHGKSLKGGRVVPFAELAPEIKPGILSEPVAPTTSASDSESDQDTTASTIVDSRRNLMDIMRHVATLICLLTIYNTETHLTHMYTSLQSDILRMQILVGQTRTWWGDRIDLDIISQFIPMAISYMDAETIQIYREMKEVFLRHREDGRTLGELVDRYFIPQELEKKQNAEYSTPYFLRQNMLDKVPDEFWTKRTNKVFEPCAGKGGFLIDEYDKFMNGLQVEIPDEEERKRTILEDILYFADINPTNIFICKLLLDPNDEYELNSFTGNTLTLDINVEWGLDGFNAVIGNPPYNDDSGNKGKGHTLWTQFIEKALSMWVVDKGYLLYVTPSLWRQADHPLQAIMKQNQIEYLEIHAESDGVKTFKCNTRYDWYLITKTPYASPTTILTQRGETVEKDLRTMSFIPNYNFDLIERLTCGDLKVDMLYSRSSYASDKKWTSKIETDEFKYPVAYSVNRAHQAKFIWSNINSTPGHYKTKKVIFGSGATGFIIDRLGDYACCEWCTGIIDDDENLDNIRNALESNSFKKEVVLATAVSKAEINRKILKYFNKDFWKEFV